MIKRKLNLFIILFGFIPTRTFAIYFPVAEPTGAALAVEGNWFKVIQFYFGQGTMVIGLALSIMAFIWVGYAVLSKFNEVREGRAEWGQLAVLTVVGCVILTINAILLNQIQPIAESATAIQLAERKQEEKTSEIPKATENGYGGAFAGQEIPGDF